jgi:hypothetical protein
MTRTLRAALVFLLAALCAAGLAVAPAQAMADNDGDGLDDGLEDAVAANFFPYVWFDSGENGGCTDPATDGNPGTAVARVRPHPADASKIAISYAILYRRDCGDWWGGGHNGDVEPFTLTLAPNGACQYGFGVLALKTIAHEGTAFEHVDQVAIGNACDWGRLAGGSPQVARIYSAENKHGNYASLGSCEEGALGNDHCSESFTRDYNVVNAGEDGARRVDELSGFQFPGEFAWTAQPFSGSLGAGGGDAGLVRDKLLDDGLLPPAA